MKRLKSLLRLFECLFHLPHFLLCVVTAKGFLPRWVAFPRSQYYMLEPFAGFTFSGVAAILFLFAFYWIGTFLIITIPLLPDWPLNSPALDRLAFPGIALGKGRK